MPNELTILHLIYLSKHWTVSEAVWVLWCHRADCHSLWWHKFWTTASSVGAAEEDTKLAVKVPIKFQGGPTKYKTFEGNLAMFAVDRVLRAVATDEGSVSWLLRFNPDEPKHIKDQLKSLRPDGLGYKNKKFYYGDERDGHAERDDLLCHYEGGERVTDYVQVGDSIIPILESGRQGTPHKVTVTQDNDSGCVRRWSSSGEVTV